MFVAQGKTCGNEIIVKAEKHDYYDSCTNICFATMGNERDVIKGKWQPWGLEVPVVLRRILNPTHLIQFKLREFRNTTSINKWVGYDLAKNDFVAPIGNGEMSDFEVYIDWDGKWLPNYTGMGIRIRFTAPYSGFYITDSETTSTFIWPYSADVDAQYLKSAEFHDRVLPNRNNDLLSFDNSKCWIVRSRCKVDKDNRLVSANYSVIQNIEFSCDDNSIAGISIISAFNPTQNDTNLEPKQ